MKSFCGAIFVLLAFVDAWSPLCSSFTSCAQCVYDASDSIVCPAAQCAWCETTSMCLNLTDPAIRACSQPRSQYNGLSGKCADMGCSAAFSTNNVYFCRGANVAALLFTIVLFLVSLVYFLWLRTIWQLPWIYPEIFEVVRTHVNGAGGLTGAMFSAHPVQIRQRVPAAASATTCPMCKTVQPPSKVLGPGEVCAWCEVVRLAFIPLFIAVSCGIVTFVTIFSISIRPSFANGYYGVLLALPFLVYILVGVYVVRLSAASEVRSTYFYVALVLRGRNIQTVYGITVAPNDESQPAPPVEPAVNDPERAREKIAETNHLLTIDYSIPAEVRALLKRTLISSEWIEWIDIPDRSKVAVEIQWLLHVFAVAIAWGVWMCICSTLTTDYAIRRMFDAGTLSTMGVLFIVLFGFGLLVALKGCSKVYVLTNRRLIIVAEGLLGLHVMSEEHSTLQYAAVLGHSSWFTGQTMTFSWEAPQTKRMLPAIKTNCFSGIRDMNAFLHVFRAYAPTLTTKRVQTLRDNLKHQRMVWRVHMMIHMFMAEVMPLVFVYAAIATPLLSALALIIGANFGAAMFQRGLRMQQITYAPLHIVRELSLHYDPMRFIHTIFEPTKK